MMKNIHYQKNYKTERGVTLIALIITIIVLLILAGVSLAMLTGNNGIISRVRTTGYESAQGELKEAMSLAISESIMDIDNPHTIDAVLVIAEANGFISSSTHTTTKTSTEATIIHDETGATVALTETSMGNIEVISKDKTVVGGTDTELVLTKLSETVQVGDYIAYDAGVWTEEDFAKITSSTQSPTVSNSSATPTEQNEFGGFILGQSRNENTTDSPRTDGWRVWDIDEETGEVTIVHAGHSESYYQSGYATKTTTVLRGRDMSMYVDTDYATSAKIMTGEDVVNWYNKQYGTSYTIADYTTSTMTDEVFSIDGPIGALENGSSYWVAAPQSTIRVYMVSSGRSLTHSNAGGKGVRALITLKSDLLTSGENDFYEYELVLR